MTTTTTTTKRDQSPRWMALALQVMEGQADDMRNAVSNKKTRNITLGSIKTLMGGFALSESQAKALVTNIRNRVAGKADFEWEGQIKLTRKQVDDAKLNPRYQDVLNQLEEPKRWIADVKSMLDQTIKRMEYTAEDPEELQVALSHLWAHIREFHDLLP